MLIVLPPSETKVAGGDEGSCVDLDLLSFSLQNPVRAKLITELVSLAKHPREAQKVLKLGPKSVDEIARNRELRTSALMPAISRYTGVLYDALGVATLDAPSQSRALSQVAVFSALFGLIRASDPIPAYRLSWDSALAGGKPARRFGPIATALWESVDDFVIDLRSEGYRNLAPLTPDRGVFVSLVTPGPTGSRGAIGHHNKGLKGRLVRDLVSTGALIGSITELCQWGDAHGYDFDPKSDDAGVIELVVPL
jgi:hypothetical protein